MGTGARKHSIDIQYCMTIPRILWESVAISSVTRARVSEDYIAVGVMECYLLHNSSQNVVFTRSALMLGTRSRKTQNFSNGSDLELALKCIVTLVSTGIAISGPIN